MPTATQRPQIPSDTGPDTGVVNEVTAVNAGDLIKKARGDWNQAQACLHTRKRFPDVPGVISTAVSHWETDRRRPRPQQLYAYLTTLVDEGHGLDPEDTVLLLCALGHGTDNLGRAYRALTAGWTHSDRPDGATEAQQRVSIFASWALTSP